MMLWEKHWPDIWKQSRIGIDCNQLIVIGIEVINLSYFKTSVKRVVPEKLHRTIVLRL